MPLIDSGISIFDLELLMLFGEVLEPLGDAACWRKHITVDGFGCSTSSLLSRLHVYG